VKKLLLCLLIPILLFGCKLPDFTPEWGPESHWNDDNWDDKGWDGRGWRKANTFYFIDNTNGSDSADGLTPEKAWKTIAKVNAATFVAGDRILFKRGETWTGQLQPPSSGASNNQIVFGAYGTGIDPIIDGDNMAIYVGEKDYLTFRNLTLTTGTVLINIDTCDYVIVEDCEIHTNGTAEDGVLVQDGSNYVTIRNNNIHDIGLTANTDNGIRVDSNSDNCTISNNIIDDIFGRGITIRSASDTNTVTGNTISDCVYSLIEIDASDSITVTGNTISESLRGVYLNDALNVNIVGNSITGVDKYAGINCVGSSNNVLIKENLVYECEGNATTTGGGIRVIVATGVTITRNVSHSNSDGTDHAYGIQVDLLDSTSVVSYNVCYLNDDQGISVLGCTGTKVYGNTCVYNLRDGIYIGEEAGTTAATSCVFKNNILAENGGEGTSSTNWNQMFIHQESCVGNSYDNNLYYRAGKTDVITLYWLAEATRPHTLAEWQARYATYDPNSVNTAPAFTAVATHDYSLSATSGAINKGTDLGSTYDDALSYVSSWPYLVITADQDDYGSAWEIGAYVY